MKKENNTLVTEKCDVLDCVNNNGGNCACIIMEHNPEDGFECISYLICN